MYIKYLTTDKIYYCPKVLKVSVFCSKSVRVSIQKSGYKSFTIKYIKLLRELL